MYTKLWLKLHHRTYTELGLEETGIYTKLDRIVNRILLLLKSLTE